MLYGGFVLNGYVLAVIGTVLISAVVTAIIPEGKTSSVVKGVTRLACVLAIVAPILSFFAKGNQADGENKTGIFQEIGIETDGAYIQYVSAIRVTEAEKSIKKEIREKYAAQIEVRLRWEYTAEEYGVYQGERVKITQIQVLCEDESAKRQKKEIGQYLANAYGCEVVLE